MAAQERKPVPPSAPKWEIPDIWAKNGRCPVCGASSLKVTHLPDLPDYLACARCEISFEVENDGMRMRVKYLPDKYEAADAVLHQQWVEAVKLSAILNERCSAVPDNKTPEPQTTQNQIISDEEAWHRAISMYRLGNKPKLVQLRLIQAGMPQEQADGILVRLRKRADQDARQQNQKFMIMAGISILVMVILAGAWSVASGNLPIILGITTVTPAPRANQASALSKLLDLVPNNAKPAIMNLPTTVVDTRNGPPSSSCPTSPGKAARLFGGTENLWKRDAQFAAWQMVTAGDSITVQVPSGMVAGYVDNKTLQLFSVHGPATIYNANFVTIMCD